MTFHTHPDIWTWCFLRAYIIDETPKPKDTVEGGKVIDGDGHEDGEASEADPVQPKEWVPCPTVGSFLVSQLLWYWAENLTVAVTFFAFPKNVSGDWSRALNLCSYLWLWIFPVAI